VKRPVVVKLGTSLIVGTRQQLRRQVLRDRAAEIAEVVKGGTPVCIVSSGAIALGLSRMGVQKRPRSIPRLQAASALGQARLQGAWEEAFADHGVAAAQILLTASDVAERRTYVNARNALNAIFSIGAVPVVNENDATATDEITFGDNDALAAQVAVLAGARLLVLLTEVEGVLSRAPGTPGAKLIQDGHEARNAVLGGASPLGKGGMRSKVVAAEVAAQAGIPTVIAAGTAKDVLVPILAGEPRGTRFHPGEAAPSAFKLWLRFGKPVSGRLRVDEGAKNALMNEGASLLAVGVARCEGRFEAGDGVEILGPDGTPFAKGIASAGAGELRRRPKGLEVVHRDRLVLY
jgi:glutamate 5-kinase